MLTILCCMHAFHSDPAQLSEIIKSDLNSISTCVKLNGLKIIVAKTQVMILNRKNKEFHTTEQMQVTFDGTELNKQRSVRFLGVHIDKDLTWKVHIAKPPSTNVSGMAGYD